MKKTNCNINHSAAWKRTARFSATLILATISLAGPALSRGNDGGARRPSSPAPTMINSSNAHVVVNFKAPGLTLSPTAASFSVITVGQSASTTITVTNKGLVSNTIKSDTVSGAGFSISGLSLPLTLAARQIRDIQSDFQASGRRACFRNGNILGIIGRLDEPFLSGNRRIRQDQLISVQREFWQRRTGTDERQSADGDQFRQYGCQDFYHSR